MNPLLISLMATVGAMVAFMVGAAVMVRRLYRKVPAGHALVVRQTGDIVRVSMTGGLVLPTIHSATVVDLTAKQLVVERRGEEALPSKDDVAVEIRATFLIGVGDTPVEIKRVTDHVGEHAGALETIRTRFEAKCGEALRVAVRARTLPEMEAGASDIKRDLREMIGADLEGYRVADVSIDLLRRRS